MLQRQHVHGRGGSTAILRCLRVCAASRRLLGEARNRGAGCVFLQSRVFPRATFLLPLVLLCFGYLGVAAAVS